jgi:hypothetical protein
MSRQIRIVQSSVALLSAIFFLTSACGGGKSTGGSRGTPDGGTPTPTPMPVVSDCSNLGAPGVWEAMSFNFVNKGSPFTLATDPLNAGVVYVGTNSEGIFKTTDCGSHWVKINTGQLGASLDPAPWSKASMNWTLVVSPKDSTIYTNSGYGASGLYKSKNGGMDWSSLFPADMSALTGNGNVEKLTIDPTNPDHLLASFHSPCSITAYNPSMSPGVQTVAYTFPDPNDSSKTVHYPLPAGAVLGGTNVSDGWGCMLESLSAGESINGQPAWTVTTCALPWQQADGVGQTMYDSKVWFYGVYGYGGVYRTATGGVSPDGSSPAWQKVTDDTSLNGGALGGVYITDDRKTLYTGNYAFRQSTVVGNDIGTVWQSLTGAFDFSMSGLNGSIPMQQIGNHLIASAVTNGSNSKFFISPIPVVASSNGNPIGSFEPLPGFATATAFAHSAISLSYDSAHHVLYAVSGEGVMRYVVPSSIY